MRIRFETTTIKEASNVNNDGKEIHHAAPPADHDHTLQAILAAVYTALRPHPEALPKVESVLAQLLGPQHAAAHPNPDPKNRSRSPILLTTRRARA